MNKPVDFPIRGFEADHEITNTSSNASLMEVLDARLSRRSVLRGGVGGAATAVLGGFSLAACGGGDDPAPAAPVLPPATPQGFTPVATLGFAPVAKSLADAVVVPAGYTASVIYALGDPLTATTPAFKNDGTDTDYDNRAGDHHDGMEYFGLSATGARDDRQQRARPAGDEPRGADRQLPARRRQRRHAPRPAAESDKEIPAHGVSVVEVRKNGASLGLRAGLELQPPRHAADRRWSSPARRAATR